VLDHFNDQFVVVDGLLLAPEHRGSCIACFHCSVLGLGVTAALNWIVHLSSKFFMAWPAAFVTLQARKVINPPAF
jgi:hypothetical protein